MSVARECTDLRILFNCCIRHKNDFLKGYLFKTISGLILFLACPLAIDMYMDGIRWDGATQIISANRMMCSQGKNREKGSQAPYLEICILSVCEIGATYHRVRCYQKDDSQKIDTIEPELKKVDRLGRLENPL